MYFFLYFVIKKDGNNLFSLELRSQLGGLCGGSMYKKLVLPPSAAARRRATTQVLLLIVKK